MSLESYRKSLELQKKKEEEFNPSFEKSYKKEQSKKSRSGDSTGYSNYDPHNPYQTINYISIPSPAIQYVQVNQRSNGFGIAGFIFLILSIISSFFLLFIPLAFPFIIPLSVFLCVIAFILSFIGLFKSPRALAFVTFIISFLSILIVCLGWMGFIEIFKTIAK